MAGSPAARDGPAAPEGRGASVLDVRNLRTYFFTYDGVVKALDGVTFRIRRGETLGLVGETGCGKSVTAFSITRLISDPPGRIMDGSIRFQGANLLTGLATEAEYRPIKKTNRVKVIRHYRAIKTSLERMTAVRGGGISMIFQEPMTALNPIFTIGNQISETLLLHRGAEILERLLHAETSGPEVEAALDGVVSASQSGDSEALRTATRRLGKTTRLSSIGTQAFYLMRASLAHANARRPELLRALERAGKGGPEAHAAIDLALAAARSGNASGLQAATDELGRVTGSPELGAQALAILKGSLSQASGRRAELVRALRRVRLSNLQRAFLKNERRRVELVAALKEVYLEEMRSGQLYRARRRQLRGRLISLRLQGGYFGIWGVKRYLRKPLTEETFWLSVQQLEGVTIANPDRVARGYPHELSGGMIQRVMIAMALCAEPELLIADEPTTALDVTIQAQILDLMRDLKERVGTAILLITHDLGVIAEVADRVAVMYAGNVVEIGPVKQIFSSPLHPYTQGLLNSVPRLDDPNRILQSIPGSVPNLIYPPTGCRFRTRCPHAMPICGETRPKMTVEAPGHEVACFLYHGPTANPEEL